MKEFTYPGPFGPEPYGIEALTLGYNEATKMVNKLKKNPNTVFDGNKVSALAVKILEDKGIVINWK
jgi:hypothetical protein